MNRKIYKNAALQIENDPIIESSIQEAKWLLGSVATLAMAVFAMGLAASAFGA